MKLMEKKKFNVTRRKLITSSSLFVGLLITFFTLSLTHSFKNSGFTKSINFLYGESVTATSADTIHHSLHPVLDIKKARYQKKFQRAVDSNINLEPVASELQSSRNLLAHVPLYYRAPIFVSEQHAFLYRLTYF